MNVRQEHRDYRSLFSDPDTCPLGAGEDLKIGIANAMTFWDTTIDTTPEDELLVAATHLLSEPAGGIGIFQSDPNCPSGILRIVHGVMIYPGSYNRIDPLRGKAYGYLDDVDGQDVTTVELNPMDLVTTDDVNVASTADQHLALLNQSAERVAVPPIADGTPDSKKIATRSGMFIPHPLVPYVIGKRLNGKQAFVVLLPVIRSLGLEEVCRPLIEFLMAAGTQHEADEETHPIVEKVGLPVHDANELLKHRRKHVLYKQLPDLENESTPPNNNNNDARFLDVVSACQGMQSASIRTAEAARVLAAEKAAPKTFLKAYGPSICDMMCKACGVDDPELLPQFWGEMAGRPSSQKIMSIIFKHFQIEGQKAGVLPPVPTGNTVTAAQNFMFTPSTEETTGTGWLPLSFAPKNCISSRGRLRMEQDEQNFQAVLTMQEGNGQVSVADARTIQSTRGYFTSVWTESEQQVDSYIAPLATLLGTDHPNVKEHKAAIEIYKFNKTYFQEAMNNKYGAAAPAVFVFFFQVHHRAWFEEQMRYNSTGLLPPPQLVSSFRQFGIGRNISWIPEIRHVPDLYRLANPVPRLPPAQIPGGGGGVNGGGNENLRPDNDIIPARRERVRARNLNRSPLFTSTNALNSRIVRRPITPAIAKAGSTPSKDGNPRCLSWHLKGTCFEDCGRVLDHVILSDAEATELYGWCRLAFE